MLVPAVDMGVFGRCGGILESFVARDVCLGWSMATSNQYVQPNRVVSRFDERSIISSECTVCVLVVVMRRGLKPPHQHGPNISLH